MSKWEAVILLIVVAVFFVGSAAADVPTSPSNVSVEGRQLIVRERLLDGSLAEAKPYIIKGLTWCPLTRAPQTGVNPFDPSENINYGFFFDWEGPNPSGSEVLNYWLKRQYWEFAKDDQGDIVLMQQMNANTVRAYMDFGDDPDIYNSILDKFYDHGIMVIIALANSRDDFEEQFYVYKDRDSSDNHFVPSGKMGDGDDLLIEDGAVNPERAAKGQNYLKNYLKISYNALNNHAYGWAGVYWQEPANNWGEIAQAGYDLSGARRLTFWARGETGGEEVEFKIGGILGVYGDSCEAVSSGRIQLTREWKKYSIDLSGKELSRIIGGFCFVVNPPAKTFYLDEIRYEGVDIAGQAGEKHYEKIVRLYKDHPAILAWSLGNEWNMNKGWGYAVVEEAARDINAAVKRIKALDSSHPVSSCLGDVWTRLEGDANHWLIVDCVSLCPDVDIWGINVYRGASFTNLFEQWQEVSSKPFYLSEFGTDSFNAGSYKLLNDYQASDCRGIEDETMQAEFIIALWDEIKDCLSVHNPNEACLGGLVHEFNDELWKTGCFHVGFENVSLGGLVDYDGPDDIPNTSDDDSSYGTYNPEGFFAPGRHPDNLSNEEYFGIVDAERNPKNAFIRLRDYYKLLDDFTAPVITGVKDKGEWTVNKNQLYAEWTAEDGESGIDSYAYRIFTRENGSEKEIIGWTDIGKQNYARVNYNLIDGKTYYFGVKAVNGAGAKSMLESDGITVDSIPPAIINQTAVSQFLPVTFTAKISDAHSGVKDVYLEIESGTKKISYPMRKGTADLYSIGLSSISSAGIKYKIIAGDKAGNQLTSAVYSLNVINKAPIALIKASRTSGKSPLEVCFYGNGCYDHDGKIVSYLWDFGNGKTSARMNPSSSFKNSSWRSSKYYTVSLTVKDNLGAAATAQIKIKVKPWWKCW
ncbi:MAG: glycoside hydrolase family 2 TIM barrel-domain containing protein [Candidatus Omnitrophota bacterium]